MSISGSYSQPVSVNGYQCWNCTDVDNAKKHIDPQHPKSGPYGVDAAQDPTVQKDQRPQAAVTFGGSLTAPPTTVRATSSDPALPPAVGSAFDLTA